MIEEIKALNMSREAALAEIQPFLMRYKNEQGAFPETLEQLVPGYISAIPAVLQHSENIDPKLRVKYESDGTIAEFRYQKTYVSGSMVIFDVGTNSYSGAGVEQ